MSDNHSLTEQLEEFAHLDLIVMLEESTPDLIRSAMAATIAFSHADGNTNADQD